MGQHWVTTTLTPLGACDDARTWARTTPDLATAWASCQRGDWMLWYAARLTKGLPPEHTARRRVVAGAVACASLVRDKMTDPRSLAALDLAQRWADGDATVTLDMMRAAAAYAYAYAAAAAYAYAAYAAAAAANAAAYAAAAAAAAYAYAAQSNMLARCADAVRAIYPTAPERKAV